MKRTQMIELRGTKDEFLKSLHPPILQLGESYIGPSRERSKKLTRVPTGGTLHHLLPRSYNVLCGVEEVVEKGLKVGGRQGENLQKLTINSQ